MAAEQEYAEAQYALGVRYLSGQGVVQDIEEAARLILLAADNGSEEAIEFLKGES